jgi:hypothetical protein
MIFITIRQLNEGMPFEWSADGRPVSRHDVVYFADRAPRTQMQSTDLLRVVRAAYPDFTPCAYLNGTERADTFKWMLTERVGNARDVFGYTGPKFLELVMSAHHLLTGRYLSHLPPRSRGVRAAVLALWPFDAGLRRAAGRFLASLVRHPSGLFRRAYFQTVMFVQPVDFLPGGQQNMCDGCPDITIWKDRLVPSCRLGEMTRFGALLASTPRGAPPRR